MAVIAQLLGLIACLIAGGCWSGAFLLVDYRRRSSRQGAMGSPWPCPAKTLAEEAEEWLSQLQH